MVRDKPRDWFHEGHLSLQVAEWCADGGRVRGRAIEGTSGRRKDAQNQRDGLRWRQKYIRIKEKHRDSEKQKENTLKIQWRIETRAVSETGTGKKGDSDTNTHGWPCLMERK